ncbi:MAG: BsuPI-related putative proteinase inhibitor [Halobacteriales archaeon]
MSLEGRLAVTVSRGGVELSFTVSNPTTEPVGLAVPEDGLVEFVVSREDTEVWRRSGGGVGTPTSPDGSLAPGESFSEAATWSDPDPGEYVAEATLRTATDEVRGRTAFEV